jgi:alpha-glucosidase
MPWSASGADLGFSAGAPTAHAPWLPLPESHRALAVDTQEAPAVDTQEAPANSLLNFYRRLLRWRKLQPALVGGEMSLLDRDAQVLAYVRTCPTQRVLCVFNLSDRPATWAVPTGLAASDVMTDSGLTGASVDDDIVALEAWGGVFVLLE